MAMRSRSFGFTLIEVLVSLAIIGLILVALNQGVRFGLLALRSEARVAADQDGLNEVDVTLRRLIGGIVRGAADQEEPPLVGRHDAMRFITRSSGIDGTSGGRRIQATLFVDDSHHLVIRWRPPRDGALLTTATAPRDSVLLRAVTSMELAFWRPGEGWLRGWDGDGLPSMVRIRLVISNPAGKHWPDIIVTPMIDGT
jgi:prepilin-type N-terminal cleavage/methylation domain-containing protein